MTAKAIETDRRLREPLTRERILACALQLIDRDGLEELSMRRLAAELDVSAMSLYNHVPNKEAVLEGVTEVLLREIELTEMEGLDLETGLKAGLRSFRRVLLDHPNALTLIETRPIVTPDALKPIELSLATLRRAGFSPDDAVRAHWMLVGYTIGHVGFQVNSPIADPSRVQDEIAMRRQTLPVEQFPNLFECLRMAIEGDFDAAFEFGLDAIFAGLKAKLAAS
jgi:AcrR family transcriptional regulator